LSFFFKQIGEVNCEQRTSTGLPLPTPDAGSGVHQTGEVAAAAVESVGLASVGLDISGCPSYCLCSVGCNVVVQVTRYDRSSRAAIGARQPKEDLQRAMRAMELEHVLEKHNHDSL
jgi:capsule polysaccharide export protein KpsC/LpsZ